MKKRLSGDVIKVHGEGAEAAFAGAGLGLLGKLAGFIEFGNTVCGRVARLAAAGSVGKYNAPGCPQPHNAIAASKGGQQPGGGRNLPMPKIRSNLFMLKL